MNKQPRILTLCAQCRATLEAGYSVKSYYYERGTTKPEPKCQYCKKARSGMEMYIVDVKRR